MPKKHWQRHATHFFWKKCADCCISSGVVCSADTIHHECKTPFPFVNIMMQQDAIRCGWKLQHVASCVAWAWKPRWKLQKPVSNGIGLKLAGKVFGKFLKNNCRSNLLFPNGVENFRPKMTEKQIFPVVFLFQHDPNQLFQIYLL